MQHLSDFSAGRANNFNLLRFIAASAVLVSHGYTCTTGDFMTEPLRRLLGMSLGTIAVSVFFVTSGFLVSGSLLSKRNATEFFLSRALRIYPGLWVAVLLSVTAIGLAYTDLSARSFFARPETWRYVTTNMLMLGFETYRLPGAFTHLPYADTVNGSLWSLPFEIRLYMLLGFSWIVLIGITKTPVLWLKWFCIGIAVAAVTLDICFLWLQVFHPDAYREPRMVGLAAAFFSGAALRVLQHRIPVSQAIFTTLVVALSLSAATSGFLILYKLTFAYVVLYVALVPRGRILHFNQLGDYSYGIYIYAFPVQQAIVYSLPGITPIQLIAMSFPLTLALAIASWHLIEKKALRFRPKARLAATVTPKTMSHK